MWAAEHAETLPGRAGPDRVPGTRVGPPPAGVISQAAGRAGLGTPPAFGARGAGIIIIINFIITCILQCTCAIIISRVSHFTRARGSPPAKWPRRALWLCCRICLCAALRGGHGVACALVCRMFLICSCRASQACRRAMLAGVCIAELCVVCSRKQCWAVCTSLWYAALMRAGWHAPFACQSVRVCACERP